MDISINNTKYAKRDDLLAVVKVHDENVKAYNQKLTELTFEIERQKRLVSSLTDYVNELREMTTERFDEFAKLIDKILPTKYRPQYTKEIERINRNFRLTNETCVKMLTTELQDNIETLAEKYGIEFDADE